jgi:hypothetical protein
MICRVVDRVPSRSRRRRAGIQAPEVVVVVVVILVLVLVVLTALPRRRESSRLAACNQNLMRIGIAATLYDKVQGSLPTVPPPGNDGIPGSSPIAKMLVALGQPDFLAMSHPKQLPPSRRRPSEPEWRIPGLLCPSDRNALSTQFAAPTSYRATAGDAADGRTGAFAPGQRLTLAEIAAADGLSYTSAFAERLVGDGRSGSSVLGDYARVAGPVQDSPCPGGSTADWRGDAGSSWTAASWQSTLYNHLLTPNEGPACISDDGRTARVGASSAHTPGTHVLLFDLSVKLYTNQVSRDVWRKLANVNDASSPRP